MTDVAAKNLFHGVNTPSDPDNMTDLEKKHLPVIDAPDSVGVGECFLVAVEVGTLLNHPNEHGHFIQSIDLYADDTFLARMDLTGVTTCPKVTFAVALPFKAEQLRAFEYCNMHGAWMGTKSIQVRE